MSGPGVQIPLSPHLPALFYRSGGLSFFKKKTLFNGLYRQKAPENPSIGFSFIFTFNINGNLKD